MLVISDSINPPVTVCNSGDEVTTDIIVKALIELSYNPIKSFAASFMDLSSRMDALGLTLRAYPTITKLDLSYANLCDQGATIIAKSIIPDMLKSLNLDGNNLTATGAKAVAVILRHGYYIRDLSISDNDIGTWGAITVIKAGGNLTKLNLSDNNIEVHRGDDSFTDAVASHDNLVSLDLSHNQLEHFGVVTLLDAARAAPNLKVLSLSHTGMSPTTWSTLIQKLPQLTQLKSLDLSGNPINSKKSALIIAKNLITTLYIHPSIISCDVSDSGALIPQIKKIRHQCKVLFQLVDLGPELLRTQYVHDKCKAPLDDFSFCPLSELDTELLGDSDDDALPDSAA